MDDDVRARIEAVKERLGRDHPELLAAVADVSPALLQWCAEQSPRQRLQACTNATRGVERIRRATPPVR